MQRLNGNGRRSFTRLSLTSAIVLFLAVFGLGSAWLKHSQLHVPLLPKSSTSIWLVEAQLDFAGVGGPAMLGLSLPEESPSTAILNESFISQVYGLAVLEEGKKGRVATWTRRRAPTAMQGLYYRAEVHFTEPEAAIHGLRGASVPAFPQIPAYREPLASAIRATLEDAREQSADVLTFTAQLLKILADPRNPNSKVIRQSGDSRYWNRLTTEILAGARIPARVVYGLSLDKPFTGQSLEPWLEVHNGDNWYGFDAANGQQGYPKNFFVWSYNDPQPFTSSGVRDATLLFSATRQQLAATALSRRYEDHVGGWTGISLNQLPIDVQNLYVLMLSLPLGALVVAFMRVVVGIPTFGTFMPILIALAFRETQILWGITFFLFVVAIGLVLRILMARLRLLLVPRLAAMLVVVILVILFLTLLSSALGIRQGLSIGLFPMVIMTLTIERMSIVWDERGPVETLKETAGTLVVAVLGFFVMNSETLTHLMRYFPELLFVVLAACLMLGTYTGYRITELVRFQDLVRSAPENREADAGQREG